MAESIRVSLQCVTLNILAGNDEAICLWMRYVYGSQASGFQIVKSYYIEGSLSKVRHIIVVSQSFEVMALLIFIHAEHCIFAHPMAE
eukprot:scaffold110318_cov33-Prasinocladus_malaysianus.AAC.1